MSKVVDPVQRVGLEVLGERDTRLFPVPEVVFRMRSDGFHKANCLDLPGHHLTTIGCRNTRSGAAPKRVASPAGRAISRQHSEWSSAWAGCYMGQSLRFTASK